MKEEVAARVTRSEAPSVLEEDQEGKTFSRHVRYSPRPVQWGHPGSGGRQGGFQGPRQARRADRVARHQEALGRVTAQAEGRRGSARGEQMKDLTPTLG